MKISKRNSLIIAGLLALSTFSHATWMVGSVDLEVGIKQCTGDASSSDKCINAIEKKQLKVNETFAKRAGKTLTITTTAKRVTFKNSGQESQSVAYTYLGTIPDLHAHLISVRGYEEGGYTLVQQDSGFQADLFSVPVASVDGKHFAIYSENVRSRNDDIDRNNVSIWRADGGKFSQVAEFKGMSWGPASLTWTPAELRVEKLCIDMSEKSSDGVKPCGSASIVKTAAGWKLLDKPTRP